MPNARVEGCLYGIKCYVFVTKAGFYVGGHRLSFDLERDELRQVYLPKTLLLMNEYFSDFQPMYVE